ncbi:RUN/FYVE domain protein isoform X3 [Carex rostrata]
MAVEMLPFSNFKLQLLSLISNSHDLQEREGSVRKELEDYKQKFKHTEAEYLKHLQELRAELDSRDDLKKKLESKIEYLENENELLQTKEKDLKDAINGLLQSRESFVHRYEDSTCTLQRTVQTKDRELTLLTEKLSAHISLFNSVQKEANSVKRAFDVIKRALNEKEQVVAGLNDKINRICTIEKDFVDTIKLLEGKLNDCKLELRRKDMKISELQEKIESDRLSNNYRLQFEELRKALEVKDETIQRLISEKQGMQHELHSMEVILQKFQETFNILKTEEKKDASSWSREMECNDCSLENHVVAINSKLDNKEDNIELIGDVSAQTDTRNLPELKHHGATEEGNSQQEVG